MSWIQGRVASACAGMIGDRLWIFSICFAKEQSSSSNRQRQEDASECVAVSYQDDEIRVDRVASVDDVIEIDIGLPDNSASPPVTSRSPPTERDAIFITDYSTRLELGSSTLDDTAKTFTTGVTCHHGACEGDVIVHREWQTNVGGSLVCHDTNCNSIYLSASDDLSSTASDYCKENIAEEVAVVNVDCDYIASHTQQSRNNDQVEVTVVQVDSITFDLDEKSVAVVNVTNDNVGNHTQTTRCLGDESVFVVINSDRSEVVDVTDGTTEDAATSITDLTVHRLGLRQETSTGFLSSESADEVDVKSELQGSGLEISLQTSDHVDINKTVEGIVLSEINLIADGDPLAIEKSVNFVEKAAQTVDEESISFNCVAIVNVSKDDPTEPTSVGSDNIRTTSGHVMDDVTPSEDSAESVESVSFSERVENMQIERSLTIVATDPDQSQESSVCSLDHRETTSSRVSRDCDTDIDKTGDSELPLSSLEQQDISTLTDDVIDESADSGTSMELNFIDNYYDSLNTTTADDVAPLTRNDVNVSHNSVGIVDASRSASASDLVDSEAVHAADNSSLLLHGAESEVILLAPVHVVDEVIQQDDVKSIGELDSHRDDDTWNIERTSVEVTEPDQKKEQLTVFWPDESTSTFISCDTDIDAAENDESQPSRLEENILPTPIIDAIDDSEETFDSRELNDHRDDDDTLQRTAFSVDVPSTVNDELTSPSDIAVVNPHVDFTKTDPTTVNDETESTHNSVAVVDAGFSAHNLVSLPSTPDQDGCSPLNGDVESALPTFHLEPLPMSREERIVNGEVDSDGGISSDDENLVNCDLVSDEVLKAWKHHLSMGNEDFFHEFDVPPTSPTSGNFLDCFSDNDEWFDDFDAPSANLMTSSSQRDIIVKSPPPYTTVSDQRTTLDTKPLKQKPSYSFPLADIPVFSVVPSSASQVQPLIDSAVEICWQCRRYGEPLDTILPPQSYFADDELADTLESTSRRTYKKLVFDLVAEVIQDIYRDDDVDSEHHSPRGEPWSGPVSASPRRFPIGGDCATASPTTIGAVGPIVSDHVLRCLGMTSLESRTLMKSKKWLLGRKANTVVDHMLVEEMSFEEPEWIRYDDDVTTRKLQIADFLMEALVYDTTVAIACIERSRCE